MSIKLNTREQEQQKYENKYRKANQNNISIEQKVLNKIEEHQKRGKTISLENNQKSARNIYFTTANVKYSQQSEQIKKKTQEEQIGISSIEELHKPLKEEKNITILRALENNGSSVLKVSNILQNTVKQANRDNKKNNENSTIRQSKLDFKNDNSEKQNKGNQYDEKQNSIEQQSYQEGSKDTKSKKYPIEEDVQVVQSITEQNQSDEDNEEQNVIQTFEQDENQTNKDLRKESQLISALISQQVKKITKFHCKDCEKYFSRQYHLTRHLLSHSEQKDFICQKCKKAFYREDVKQRHMLTHTKQGQFACNACKKKFKRKDNLNVHINICSKRKNNVYSYSKQ